MDMIKGDVVYDINANILKTIEKVVQSGITTTFVVVEGNKEFRLPWQFLSLSQLGNIYGNLEVQKQVLKYKK